MTLEFPLLKYLSECFNEVIKDKPSINSPLPFSKSDKTYC